MPSQPSISGPSEETRPDESSGARRVRSWLGEIVVQLADETHLTNVGTCRWTLQRHTFERTFSVCVEMNDILAHLAGDGWPLSQLAARLDAGAENIAVQLNRLWIAGYLTERVAGEEGTIATLRTTGESPFVPPFMDSEGPIGLAEDACVRGDQAAISIEALEFGAAVTTSSRSGCRLVGALFERLSCQQIAARTGVAINRVRAFVALLHGIGAVEQGGSLSRTTGWAFADRLVHARSRLGRHLDGYGGTFRFRDRLPEPPAARPRRDGATVELPPVAAADSAAGDVSFFRVLAERCSVREVRDQPIGKGELSQFLSRSFRPVRHILPDGRERIARPSPTAGGLDELEVYPLVNRCTGVPAGLHRYDSVGHYLEVVSAPTADTQELLADAARSAGMQQTPDVLIILAARFPRVNYKYESLAYSLVLKNVGVAYQTMYLVSTALGLAPCAIGGGSSATFCRAAGTSYWEESSVGEFMLGGRRGDRRASPSTSVSGATGVHD